MNNILAVTFGVCGVCPSIHPYWMCMCIKHVVMICFCVFVPGCTLKKAWRWRHRGWVKLVMRSLENRLHNGVMEGGSLPSLHLHPASREIREQFLFHIWWRGPWKTLFTNPNRNKAVGRSVAASCRGSIMGCLRRHWEVQHSEKRKKEKEQSVCVYMIPFFSDQFNCFHTYCVVWMCLMADSQGSAPTQLRKYGRGCHACLLW